MLMPTGHMRCCNFFTSGNLELSPLHGYVPRNRVLEFRHRNYRNLETIQQSLAFSAQELFRNAKQRNKIMTVANGNLSSVFQQFQSKRVMKLAFSGTLVKASL
jgi:hypothetical protein